MAVKSYEIDMCRGPLLGKILRFSFPLMLSSILQLLFNAADVITVGQFAGKEAMEELKEQSMQVLKGDPIHPEHFPYQIAFNVIPQIDVWVDGDYTKEEMKLVWETHKIMGDDAIGVTPVCAVRIPVMRSHCEAVYLETEKPLSVEKCRELFAAEDYIVLQDDPEHLVYPMPVTSTDTDKTYVGRIRKDTVNDHALNMWISFDQLRKGAATNAVQILEELIKRELI